MINLESYLIPAMETTNSGNNNRASISIFGRNFNLPIVYDKYTGEQVLPIQIEAVKKFLTKYKNIDTVEIAVKRYILNRDKDKLKDDMNIENIFKYIKPKSIYIRRSEKDRYFIIIFNYKFDPEDGMVIVFKNESYQKIGTTDEC